MDPMTAQVRVRFAPSPTGYLHVGGARTAVFNWLFARHHGGTFILRIEDTDVERSSEDMVEGILQGMKWLGLDWDEGPLFQADRLNHYQEFAGSLLENGSAYRCFCTPDELAQRKNSQQKTEGARLYDRKCLALAPEESDARARSGMPFAVRFCVPEGRTVFQDRVFGPIEVDNSNIEDFVLLRSDGIPTYHLAVVLDDLEMDITHVIRGADHISNTPKQILLYRAAGRPLPEFAHLPLILGPDKQRLSKRHGATSVIAYRDVGCLAEAFFNFLALLGWSPGDDREILSRRELIELFSLEGVGKANAVFGMDKLRWFNSQHLVGMAPEELRALVTAELQSRQVWHPNAPALDPESVDRILALLKGRAHLLTDFSGLFRSYFVDEFDYDPGAVDRFLHYPELKSLVPALLERFERHADFAPQSLETQLRALAQDQGVKAGLLINALRVGLTGQGVAPGLFDVMLALGRKRTLDRIGRLARYLEQLG